MSIEVSPPVEATPRLTPAEKAQSDRRVELNIRFLEAGLIDTSLLEDIPRGVTFFLLPDDDPAFVEQEIAFAADAARRGEDVYLRHVRVADLPPVRPPRGTRAGDRRIEYGADGTITANLVYGADGAWHATDEPPPGPRDDEPE